MLRIEPTITNTFKQNPQSAKDKSKIKEKGGDSNTMLSLSITGLAIAGLAAVGLKKTYIMSYEEALKKNGVEIKNGIATFIKTGKKFTGKIQRFEARNRKETVEFADGIIQEKIYHNLFGRELDGMFYKDGKLRLKVTKHGGSKHKAFGVREYDKDGNFSRGEAGGEIDSVFAWARKAVKESSW